jgi:hypothetical protein
VKTHWVTKRIAAFVVVTALVMAFVVHASHGHDAHAHASQLHATCVVCQFTAPVATQSAPVEPTAEADPTSHLSHADRDHAIPPARVDVDLSRAPPAFLAS